MRNYFLTLITISIIGCMLFSCDSSEYDDSINPQIKNLTIPDTLYVGADTLNSIFAELSDDKGLSGYKVQIFPHPSMPDTVRNDSIALKKFVKTWDAFGNAAAAAIKKFQIPATYTVKDVITSKSQDYPVLTGKYICRFACIDLAGNRDSIDTEVILLYSIRSSRE